MKKATTAILFAWIPFVWYSQQISFSPADSLNFEFRAPKGFENYESFIFEKSSNNNCASAASLTPGAACLSSNTVGDNTQAGEVAPPCSGFGGGGVNDRTNWFRFTASSAQMVLDFNSLIATNCATSLAVYGPFASGTGCLPTAAQSIYCENQIGAGDPGDHNLLSGLVPGQDYLVQILNKDCGGGNSGEAYFCLGVSNVAANNTVSSASVISSCGAAFNGSNAQGYYPSGTGTGLANLDGNNATTCSGCIAGNDVPYVMNNDSWFSFCSANTGQWQIQFNVGTCFQSPPNAGLQMSIFTGTTSNLVNFQNAPSPSAPGTSFSSSTISLSAGQCAYLVVDGFAGDQCTYSYTLTNISGGCILLPVELISFDVQRFEKQDYLKWIVESENNNDYFTIRKSYDGVNWKNISTVSSVGDHEYQVSYSYMDEDDNESKVTYYELSQTDLNGRSEVIALKAISGKSEVNEGFLIDVVPNPATEESFSISIESKYDIPGTLSIKNSQGQEVYSKNLSVVRGANIHSIEGSELTHGVYYLELETQKGKEIKRFIKM